MKRFGLVVAMCLTAVTLGSPAGAQVPDLLGQGGTEDATDIEHEVLSTNTQDPTDIAVTSDGRVIWTEREGEVLVRKLDGTVVSAGILAVSANACNDCVSPDSPALEEGGLHGLLLARDFDDSGRLYLYYSVPGSFDPETNEGKFRLSTFVLSDANVLDLSSEVVILENPAEWGQCCHYGGDLSWMPDGTLVMSVGDDTNPHASNGYAPIDERADRAPWNAQRTSANPADRRGKILRLMPDGSVPDGTQDGIAPNPHVDDPAYDPYVYAMGFRSNYRISVDPDTGTVYVGNVGPDARNPMPLRGPEGYDELEVVPPGGGTNHGWPYCIGANTPYYDYDFTNAAPVGVSTPFDCSGMVPAAIWYPYGPPASVQWPALGTGSRTAIAGDVYKYEGDGALALPARFQDKLLFFEWSRNHLLTVPVQQDGTLDTTMLRRQVLATGSTMNHPHDTSIGPDGAVYMVEYGTAFYNSTNSRVVRLKCAGCTPDPADYGSGAGALGGELTSTQLPLTDPSSKMTTSWFLGAALLALVVAVVGGRRRKLIPA